MPTGSSELGACGIREWGASIFAAVGPLTGLAVWVGVKPELRRTNASRGSVFLGTLPPTAGPPTCVHYRDDFYSGSAAFENFSSRKGPQSDLTDARFHLSVDRRFESDPLKGFAGMGHESASEFALLFSVKGSQASASVTDSGSQTDFISRTSHEGQR